MNDMMKRANDDAAVRAGLLASELRGLVDQKVSDALAALIELALQQWYHRGAIDALENERKRG